MKKKPADARPKLVTFLIEILNNIDKNVNYLICVIFSDEVIFYLNDCVN